MERNGWTWWWVLATAVCVALGIALALPAWAQTGGMTTYAGKATPLGHGLMWTWVMTDAAGVPQAVGVTLTEEALSGLPGLETEYMLDFPPQAAGTASNHFALDWLPYGHEPEGVYTVPHFDFHFYLISRQERAQITATGEDLARVERAPAPEFIPQGYVPIPGGVPGMGAHWVNPATPELHGQPFTQTLLYGFYNGHMIFIEPMVTLAFLQSKPCVSAPLALPQAYPTHAAFPTCYAITYDPARRQYSITLGGLVPR